MIRNIRILFLLIFLASVPAASQNKASIKTAGSTGSIDIVIEIGDIKISTWDKNEVYAESDDDQQISLTQNGSTVKAAIDSRFPGSDIKVTLPKGFNVNAETNFGDIKIDNHIGGNVQMRSAGGDLTMNSVGGDIQCSTEGGDVRVLGDASGNVTIKTSGGDIKLNNIKGQAKISTMGGDISANNIGGSFTANSMGGNISCGSVGGNAEIKTSGGNVKAADVKDNASLETLGGDIYLLKANGKVTAKTSGGNIRLQNITGSVNASTLAGNVEVELTPAPNSNNKISSSNGRVTLIIPASAKTNITALSKSHGWWGESEEPSNIKSDFPETTEQKEKGRFRTVYVLNDGGSNIELEVMSGDIQIKKAK